MSDNTDNGMTGDEPATMTIEDAAAYMGISTQRMYKAVKREEIPTVRLGRRILVLVKPFRRMLGQE